jgi:hypothetical protein
MQLPKTVMQVEAGSDGRQSWMPALRIAALALGLALAACAANRAGGPMTADQARRALAEQGYAGLRDLRPMGSGFAAEATRDGRDVTVVIDADGIIHTQ